MEEKEKRCPELDQRAVIMRRGRLSDSRWPGHPELALALPGQFLPS